ncbi:hypothetical protein COV53_01465 [Candidatus Gottesmanbacteria bacterium CG11_big_fil_rev_8_21_14_0_20_37_11]|uniref:Histidinol-phosphatase n=2 Tax=Candidatus Gottesmaniibacteriota TaxID=1752720 RepID=A0A2M7RSG0_9BACT|nr:MAG: hypothetical protein COX23_00765 [Candidatus Gottesmanbacteria bacterium CG23_combo_of_CG06-09_8_20_14_all_37_19]PIR08752.1 MAG: hypothetical protein COV53_01465 [Candidatus Gottesmanbacteria bacterium CG11_big_fil_rev_8_21_14_0_20_37_11]PIZ03150.1 MAG: hypothetical protein COY59_00960 [Candidatus Gottesmanbacteria bacterium CG_4_10_14_0_8_um_filter_37_24]
MKKKRRLFDYHTQTIEHGMNKQLLIKETVKAAIDRKLTAICLTDHYPLPLDFVDSTHDDRVYYPDYLETFTIIQKKYKGEIEVLLGAEFDWFSQYTEWIRKEINKYPFDYVIGSVHYLGAIKDDDGERIFCHDFSKEEFMKGFRYFKEIKIIVKKYYKEVRNMVNSKLFDGVGHLDLIKKYNDGGLFDENDKWYKDAVIETLNIIASSGMVMEINTAGLDKPCKAQYPSFWIIKEAYERSIPITIGSDAHVPKNIGKNLDKAVQLAQKAGYKKLVRFVKRRKIEVNI